MAETEDGERFEEEEEEEEEEARQSDGEGLFVWDEVSNLYLHASSGFYHDPNAGWYYSSRDGLYYTFENGAYVPLPFNKDEESEHQESTSLICSEPVEDKQCNEETLTGNGIENHRPPSEWLEETLINIYLSGHSDREVGAETSATLESNDEELHQISCEGLADQFALDKLVTSHQVEQDVECIHEGLQDAEVSTDASSSIELSPDEEKWQAQYGQAVQVMDEYVPNFTVIDMWDWEKVVETDKKGQHVTRLVGRLVRRSSKLHPSVPSGAGILKTASIRDVHLNLVRVASGKVYRLRTPNNRCLSVLSAYDSSNPTKDWGFPDLFVSVHNSESACLNQTCGSNNSSLNLREKPSCTQDAASAIQESHYKPYRDRAAERRSLHGQYSIGPGQKNISSSKLYEEESTLEIFDPEEAAAEAMNMTFGKGSYARRILENMGWRDGEALGSTSKGILEPLQAVANKGNTGLGWNHTRR